MPSMLKGLFSLPTARLSRRIVFWVFVSVVVIEAIILIPSYNRREQARTRTPIPVERGFLSKDICNYANDRSRSVCFRTSGSNETTPA
jgi:hypothetical protein